MEKVIVMIPLLIVVGGLGVTIGIYISSQLKCHIRKNINRKNLEEYESKYKDTECEVFNKVRKRHEKKETK